MTKFSMLVGWLRRRTMHGFVAILAAGTPAAADARPDAADSTQATRRVGMEGVYVLRYRGPALRPKPATEKSPLLLRVADMRQEGDAMLYLLRYIGAQPGRYDLRDALERVDGQPHEGLAALPVTVQGLLPERDNGELIEPAPFSPPRPWAYRAALRWLTGLWLAPLAGLAVWRVVRRQKRRPAPSLGDSAPAHPLAALIEAAIAGRLAPADAARLELLLVGAWRERHSLKSCTVAEAWQWLRACPDTGQKLHELEAWLHRPDGQRLGNPAALLAGCRWAALADKAAATEAEP